MTGLSKSIKKVFIATGEPSGDLYGSIIASALKKLNNNLVILGIGAELMKKSGVKIIRSSKDLATFGFFEGLTNYLRLKRIFEAVVSDLVLISPDVFLPIAFSGFNLKLAKRLKNLGTKVIYFAPPQIWAWGRWRAKDLKESTDKVVCLFPFEEKFFQDLGINAIYLGNPLLDYIEQEIRSECTVLNSIPASAKIITFMPGSREIEIKNHLPLMLAVFKKLQNEFTNLYGFVIAEKCKNSPEMESLHFITEQKYQIMAKSDLIVLCSGTAALEAAILKIPHLAVYRLSLPSYLLARCLVKSRWFTLTNILLQEDAVPEFIQPNLKKLYPVIVDYLKKPTGEIVEKLSKVKKLLGQPGAAERIAQAILE